MKFNCITGATLAVLLVSLQLPVFSHGVIDWPNDAQIVCVATANAVTPAQQPIYDGVIPYLPVYSYFAVKTVLGRGVLPSELTVAGYRPGWISPTERSTSTGEHYGYLSAFQPGTTYLLFLTKAPVFTGERFQDRAWRLAWRGSLVPVGANIPIISPDDSIPLSIVKILTAQLNDPSPVIQDDALSQLACYSPYLYDYNTYPSMIEWAPGRTPTMWDQNNVAAMLRNVVIPELINKEKTADATSLIKIRTALGFLQVPDVIPDLIKDVHPATGLDEYSPDRALSSYGVPSAIPFLAKGATNSNPDAAIACMRALSATRDVRSAGGLIQALLKSSDSKVRYQADVTLFDVTGQLDGNHYSAVEFIAHEKEVDQYWRDWAAKNKIDLSAL